MDWKERKGLIGLIGFLLVALILILLPVKIPYTITVEGKLYPAREWILVKQLDGSIQITEKDNRINLTNKVTTYQIDRGDLVEFYLNPEIQSKNYISRNDTIGIIISNETIRQLAELKSTLAVARGNLLITQTGQKETTLNIAQEQVNQAREKWDYQNKLLVRKKKLYDRRFISDEEFDLVQSTARVLELELLAAQANLHDLKSGAKPEEIALYQSEIKGIEEEVQALEDRLKKLTLAAPLDGNLIKVFFGDTLLIVGDTSTVVVMPVNIKYLSDLSLNQDIRISNKNLSGTSMEGAIFNLGRMTRYLNNEEIVLVTGIIRRRLENIPMNVVVTCSIKTKGVTIRQYLIKFIESMI